MIQVEIGEGERDEREELEPAVAKIDTTAESQRHQGCEVRELRVMDRQDPPRGGYQYQCDRDGHGMLLGEMNLKDRVFCDIAGWGRIQNAE